MVRRTGIIHKGSPTRRRVIISDTESDEIEDENIEQKKKVEKKKEKNVAKEIEETITTLNENNNSNAPVITLVDEFLSLNVHDRLHKKQVRVEITGIKTEKNEIKTEAEVNKTSIITEKIPLSQNSSSFIYSPFRSTDQPTNVIKSNERLIISKLILTNFKSYAGRQCIGPFHPSFSSIVGPNGSGKSNVIDALLFVFGFRASQMRQSKLSALIHKSLAYPDIESCSVEVYFEEIQESINSDSSDIKYTVKPGSHMVISRKAFKNNTSKYMINNCESNYTEITLLLKKKGIDLDHKRFLILQGEVESIAQMKPKAPNDHEDGLLEYLEDIIGTSNYKKPIEETSIELDRLNELCEQRLNRVSVVKKEKDTLESRKEAALSYIRNENMLIVKQSKLYQAYVYEYNINVETTRKQIEKLKEMIDMDESVYKTNSKEIKELEKQHEKTLKEHEELEKDLSNTQKEFTKYDQENIKLQEKQKHLIQKQKKNNTLIQTNSHSYSESITWIENYTQEIKSYEKDISLLKNKLEIETKELEKIRFDLKDKTQDISDQLEIKQKQLEPWIEQINIRQSKIDVINSEIKILVDKENKSQQEINNIQERIQVIEKEDKITRKTIQQCQTDKENKEKELLMIKEEFEKMKDEEKRFKEKLSQCHQKEDEAKASFSKFQNHNSVLTGLMRLKESGRIDGFHGRLGSLGTIPDKYDIAVSTACPSLNHMVVETVEAGQQCIEYLRTNNLGRAVFIILSRLPSKSMERIETPENVPRLFDLITPKEKKFAPAFFNALQHTLVAEDLQQANRIAYGKKRWRVVTLNGQLIDKSGTMTGGGNKIARGGMSNKLESNVSSSSIKKYEQDRKIVEEAYQIFNSKYMLLRNKIDDMAKEIPELDIKISILSLELSTHNKDIIDTKKTLKELSSFHQTSTIDINNKKKLENEVSKLEEENEMTRKNMIGIEQEIKQLQDRIMEIGGIRLRSQKAKVDNLQDQLNTIHDRIADLDVSKIKKEKEKIKLEKAINDSKNELQIIETQLFDVKTNIEKKSKLIDDISSKIKTIQKEMDNKADELAETKLKLNKMMEESNVSRAKEIETKNKLQEYNKNLFDNEKKLKHWEDKLKNLKLQNIEELLEEDEPLELQVYTKEELECVNMTKLKAEIATLEEKTQNVKVELDVLEEYRKREQEYKSRTEDLEKIINERNSVRSHLNELKQTRLNEFMIGFNSISLKLKEMYQMITMGGNAELELVDSLDPFSEGILFSVMPPKKTLVFALHHYKPTPLYVMDEIDAALDFRNVSIIANYIKDRTKNAQLIVISLRNNMFELSSRLIGIYKTENMTKRHLQSASCPGMGRTHSYMTETNMLRRPEVTAQPGLAVLQLLQFIDGLNSIQKQHDLTSWRTFIHTYFTDYAMMRLSLTSQQVQTNYSPRVFELPILLLPIFFWTNYESGVSQMQFVLGTVKEHVTVSHGYVVACPHAKLIYWYTNGSQVVTEGNLCVQFTPALLKMEWFEFTALRHDEYILRSAACSNLPASLVNDLGITCKVLRCLEIGESLAEMYTLMIASQVNRLGPLKTLSHFASLKERANGIR
ncbi:hypothetical protein PCANB_002284 [Pneumocystis canis]|nr:hypothetical protein PCANB_002284 [Pneumocystis canis]